MSMDAILAGLWITTGRFITPQPVDNTTVIIVAGIGVVINTATALFVHLVISSHQIDNRFLETVQKEVHHDHGIEHATIQVEREGIHSAHDPDCC